MTNPLIIGKHMMIVVTLQDTPKEKKNRAEQDADIMIEIIGSEARVTKQRLGRTYSDRQEVVMAQIVAALNCEYRLAMAARLDGPAIDNTHPGKPAHWDEPRESVSRGTAPHGTISELCPNAGIVSPRKNCPCGSDTQSPMLRRVGTWFRQVFGWQNV
jgi:hypothetical protein